MMKLNKKIMAIVGSVVLAVLLVGGVAVKASVSFWDTVAMLTSEKLASEILQNSPDLSVGELMVGALSSPEINSYLRVRGNFTWGADVFATTTTSTSETIKGGDLNTYGYWDIMSNKGALTYTMPATSTMISILPKIGMSRKWILHNATTSSAITLTIAAGAGMDLVGVSNAADVLDPGEWAELTCSQIYYRSVNNENILCIITELENAE